MQTNPRYWWTGVFVISIELILYDLFLILFLIRLNYNENLSWYVVASPIWVLLFQSALRDLFKYAYQTPRMTIHYLLFRISYDILLSLALLNFCLRLNGIISDSVPWTVILIPLWIDGIFNSIYLALAPGPSNVDIETSREYRSNLWYAALIHFGSFGLQAGLISLKVDNFLRGSWSNIFIPSFLALIFLVIALAGTTLHLIGVFCPSCFRLRSLTGAQRVVFAVLLLLAMLAWMWLVCIFQSFETLVSTLSDPKISLADKSEEIIAPMIIVITATVILLPLLVAGLVAAGVNHSALATAAGQGSGHIPQPVVSLIPLANSVMMVRQSSMYFKRTQENLLNTNYESESQSEGEKYHRDDSNSMSDKNLEKLCYVCESHPANAVLLECGHGGICYECGQGLVNQRTERSCPICREFIEHIVKLPEDSQGRIGRPFEVQEGVSVRICDARSMFIPSSPSENSSQINNEVRNTADASVNDEV